MKRLGNMSANDAMSRDGRIPRGLGPFQPSGVLLPPAGALLWYDAANIDGTNNSSMADLDAVSSWHDGGSRGENCDQVTASAQPVYRNTGGEEYVNFAGNDVLWTAIYSELAQPYTIACWAGIDSGLSGAVYVIAGDGAGRRHIIGDNPSPGWKQFAGTAFVNLHTETFNSYESAVALFDGASSHLVLNGVDVGPADPGSQADRALTIGGVRSSLTANYQGRVKEVMLYAGDRLTDIQTYLDLRHGAGPVAF
jgi:hypothetical protein